MLEQRPVGAQLVCVTSLELKARDHFPLEDPDEHRLVHLRAYYVASSFQRHGENTHSKSSFQLTNDTVYSNWTYDTRCNKNGKMHILARLNQNTVINQTLPVLYICIHIPDYLLVYICYMCYQLQRFVFGEDYHSLGMSQLTPVLLSFFQVSSSKVMASRMFQWLLF